MIDHMQQSTCNDQSHATTNHIQQSITYSDQSRATIDAHTVPMGGSMPSGPGWMPEDIHAHVH